MTELKTEKMTHEEKRTKSERDVQTRVTVATLRTGLELMDSCSQKLSELSLEMGAQYDLGTHETVELMQLASMVMATHSQSMYHLAMTLTHISEE